MRAQESTGISDDKDGGGQAPGEKTAISRNNLREISAAGEFCGMFPLHQVPLPGNNAWARL